jgi:hypothetical protein
MQSWPNLTGEAVATIVQVTAHLFFVASFLAKIVLLFTLAWSASDGLNRFVRFLALFTGLTISVAAEALDLSITELIIKSIRLYNPFVFYPLDVLLPATLGFVLCWYLTHVTKRGTEFAMRVVILVSTLAVIQFAELYVKVVAEHGTALGRAFVPNIVFTTSIMLWVIFRVSPGE